MLIKSWFHVLVPVLDTAFVSNTAIWLAQTAKSWQIRVCIYANTALEQKQDRVRIYLYIYIYRMPFQDVKNVIMWYHLFHGSSLLSSPCSQHFQHINARSWGSNVVGFSPVTPLSAVLPCVTVHLGGRECRAHCRSAGAPRARETEKSQCGWVFYRETPDRPGWRLGKLDYFPAMTHGSNWQVSLLEYTPQCVFGQTSRS